MNENELINRINLFEEKRIITNDELILMRKMIRESKENYKKIYGGKKRKKPLINRFSKTILKKIK